MNDLPLAWHMHNILTNNLPTAKIPTIELQPHARSEAIWSWFQFRIEEFPYSVEIVRLKAFHVSPKTQQANQILLILYHFFFLLSTYSIASFNWLRSCQCGVYSTTVWVGASKFDKTISWNEVGYLHPSALNANRRVNVLMFISLNFVSLAFVTHVALTRQILWTNKRRKKNCTRLLPSECKFFAVFRK